MKQELKEIMRNDIALFAEKIHAFEAKEIELKAYKGFSGGFGSYPQRNGGNMLRMRMSGYLFALSPSPTVSMFLSMIPVRTTSKISPRAASYAADRLLVSCM